MLLVVVVFFALLEMEVYIPFTKKSSSCLRKKCSLSCHNHVMRRNGIAQVVSCLKYGIFPMIIFLKIALCSVSASNRFIIASACFELFASWLVLSLKNVSILKRFNERSLRLLLTEGISL